jgi:hypothetical protein
MKPNEKAQELYDKFARWLPDSGDISKQDVQQCCIIAVNEILDNCYEVMKPFWLEVKQEIESL